MLGDNLKALRKERRWTQGELAEKSGIKLGHISKLERNESDPKVSTIYKLIEALGCNADELLIDADKYGDIAIKDLRCFGAMDEVSKLEDDDRTTILKVIEKYCAALKMEKVMRGE